MNVSSRQRTADSRQQTMKTTGIRRKKHLSDGLHPEIPSPAALPGVRFIPEMVCPPPTLDRLAFHSTVTHKGSPAGEAWAGSE